MRKLFEKARTVGEYPKVAVKLGAIMMLCYYIVGMVAYIIAPYAPNYLGAMGVFRGSLEAAPASLVSGICAAVLCDLELRSKKS